MTITQEELDGLVYTQLLARGQELYAELEAAANKIGGPMGEMTRLYIALALLDYERAVEIQVLQSAFDVLAGVILSIDEEE